MNIAAEHSTPSSPPLPFLDKELAGCLIDSAWIAFITRALTTPRLLGRMDVVRELDRIEKSGEIETLRKKFQREIDQLIDSLLGSPAAERPSICLHTDLRIQALVLDRVQAATFRLVETARPDRVTPVETVRPLLQLFRRVLSGEPV